MEEVLGKLGGIPLTGRAIRGTFWLFSLRASDQVLGFLKTVIIARLLAPSDVGLFAVALLSMSILEAFSQTGFQQALVQKKGDIRDYLDTVWTAQIIRGIILALLVFLLSWAWAAFFNVPSAVPVIQMSALAILIQGFLNIGIVYFQKEIELNKYFRFQFLGGLFDFIATASAAFYFRNAWALVVGLLVGSLARVFFSYFLHSYRPKIVFSKKKFFELFHFGKWITLSNIVGFFMIQGDSFFVGRMLGAVTLGFYQIANKIVSFLSVEVITGAIFPTLSKVQDDIQKLRKAYLKVFQLCCFILIPLASALIVFAPEAVAIVLGSRWLPAVPALRLLSGATFLWSLAVISNPVFLAKGKPQVETRWGIVRLIILLFLVFPLVRSFGLTGAALAVLFSSGISGIGFWISTVRLLGGGYGVFLKNFLASLFNALVTASLAWQLKSILPGNLVGLMLAALISLFVYLFIAWILDKLLKCELKTVLKEGLRGLSLKP